ncbi:MAG: hypothetical protein M3010_08400 [Candidatus Dormibacteraeota bacterium]|nr:hypothetical protein [Candidatus Dormibacteraeota bacterium]
MAAAALVVAAALLPEAASAAPTPSPSPLPCLRTLKFGGSLFLDADRVVPTAEVGPVVGETDPNPTRCAIPDRMSVHRHTGHNTTAELVYYVAPGQPELFQSGGSTGFPMQSLVRWLVLVLVVGILGFAALPAIMAHLRQPPVEIADRPDDEARPEPKISSNGH